MHPEALAWVEQYATSEPLTVLDIGGRFINGTPRVAFPNADYTVLDIRDGSNVDIVADAATWIPDQQYDGVVCCEVFEHTDIWPRICATAYEACAPGGWLIVTTAGPGRTLHSGVDGGPELHPGETYANIEPTDLYAVLAAGGWTDIVIDHAGLDVRAYAIKPREAT
jgi:hypothetical protein